MPTRKGKQVREHPAAEMQNVADAIERRLVAINDKGRRVGEEHHKAKLSNNDIELMRRMYEEYPVGHPKHLGFSKLAKIFECSRTHVVEICTYQQRAQTVAGFRPVVV